MAGQGSARVTLNEIDLSQVSDPQITPQGVPAAVVGPASKGPAFVPRTFANIQQFEQVFGSMSERGFESNSSQFGPIALNEWLNNSSSGIYLRVLGIGNGKASSNGIVDDAGFVVGQRLVQEAEDNFSLGTVRDNPHANITDSEAALELGRTHFLGCFMKDTASSDYLKDSGIDTDTEAKPVIRGVLMTPQGVRPALDTTAALADFNDIDSTTESEIRATAHDRVFGSASGGLAGFVVGEVDGQDFTLILNGFSNINEPHTLTCSFDPKSSTYFAKVLNTDSTKIEERGHYLYTWWDIDPALAIPSNSGLQRTNNINNALTNIDGTDYTNMVGFLVANQEGRNAGNLNYEKFTARYQTAKTPWIKSQDFGGKEYKLFRLHSLDDGEAGNKQYRLLVSDLRYNGTTKYGRFDLSLEKLNSDPIKGDKLIVWKNLTLDPEDTNFVARVIGDQHTYFDFDLDDTKQRIRSKGVFEVRNRYVRVELSDDLSNGNVPIDALPTGFLSHARLVTNTPGNFLETGLGINVANIIFNSANATAAQDLISLAETTPINFVHSTSRFVTSSTKESVADLAWGVKFAAAQNDETKYAENSELIYNDSIVNYAKYFPHFGGVWVEDDGLLNEQEFQKGRFSLEQIRVKRAEDDMWADAFYDRTGSDSTANFTNILISEDAKGTNVRFLKFRCLFQGGFDGVNIFDKEKASFTGVASLRESFDEKSEGKYSGPTVVAYQKACDVLSDKSAAEFKLLALPGQRAPVVTDYALRACEQRFDALYVMDVLNYDAHGTAIEESQAKPHVRNTISNFTLRSLNSSFGAAYFPDILMSRPSDGAGIIVPPSVGVLGMIARSDALSAPWFAPAGLNRGRLNSRSSTVQMNRDLLDELYDADINPIYEPAGRAGEVYVFGQKTLLQDESALDRINVRRLLIDIRRKVKKIGESLLFEPNRESTLARFSSLVEPIMADVQRRQGVVRYKVQIDSSTTTQNDIENNTIRGKIYLQPTKSVEFISLDFVVANTIQQ